MTLGELLLEARGSERPKGSIAGTCVMCSCDTDEGLKVPVSDNFTGWNRFFAGNCMCPECAVLFSDQTYRKKSWVAAPGFFATFKNDEAKDILFNPPGPPFFIHIAKQGQRQSWLACLHRVAHNPNRYWFSHESYDVPVLFEREKAGHYVELAVRALDLGVTKTELRTGEFKPKTWKEAYEHGYQDFLRELAKLKSDLLWEVMLDVSRGGKQRN